jgi:hypothetical protein
MLVSSLLSQLNATTVCTHLKRAWLFVQISFYLSCQFGQATINFVFLNFSIAAKDLLLFQFCA